MALENMDPRNGGACSNLMAKKFVSSVMGYVQLVLSVCSILTVMFDPSSLGMVVENNGTAAILIAVLIIIFCIAFSVILLIGLHKNRRLYVKSYCIFVAVYLVLLAVSFVVNIFVQPQNLGFRGFFSTVITFLLYVLFFVVVRSYYLITYCNDSKMASNRAPV